MLRNHKAMQGDFVMKRPGYLLLAFRNTFAAVSAVISPIVDVMHYGAISDFLRSQSGKRSVFERLDLRDGKGEPWWLVSPSCRRSELCSVNPEKFGTISFFVDPGGQTPPPPDPANWYALRADQFAGSESADCYSIKFCDKFSVDHIVRRSSEQER